MPVDVESRTYITGIFGKIKYIRGVIGEVSPGEIVTAGKLNSVAIATEDRLHTHFAFSLEYDLDQSAYRGKDHWQVLLAKS